MKYLKLSIVILSLLFITGCGNVTKFNYNIKTSNENVTIEFKNKDGYKMEEGYPFNIKRDDTNTTLEFITSVGYEYYEGIVRTDSETTLIDDSKDLLYKYKNEYVYLIDINDVDAYAMLKSSSEDNIKYIYNNLKIKKA